MSFDTAMTHLHVVDLDRKRQSRIVNKVRTHSPASSTGTFFDDDHTAETRSLNTSWSGSTRADSACSSHSDERKASERAERTRRRQLANEAKPVAPLPYPHPADRSKHERTSSRAEMWPPALRIVKSPTFEDPRPTPYPPGMLPSTVYGGSTSSSSSANAPATYPPALADRTPSTDSVMSRPRPRMHRRLESAAVIDDSSSSSSRNSGQSIRSAALDSAVGFENPWSPKSESATSKTPGMLNSLAAMGTSPRSARDNTFRPRVAPAPIRRPTDWTAVAPSTRHRPEPLMKLPTPPLSPSQSVMDLYSPSTESADIVIGRRVTVKGRDRSSSVPESAMSPKSPDFANMAIPSTPSDTSRNTRIHCPDEENLSTRPQKELPPHPHLKRRSASADQASKRGKLVDRLEALPAKNGHRYMHSTNTSISNLSAFRPDRRTVVTETIRELNAKSAAHYERYTKLRQGRQCLHSQILSALQGKPTAPSKGGAKTPLQLQIEIATMDAGIDDCMSKLSTLEKKRQRLTEELLDLTAMRSPPLRSPASSTHGRNDSLGVQEILTSPRSPAIGGMAAMMAGFSFEDKHSQKLLPKIPQKQRESEASLSLANVMDFLDTDDQDGY